MTGQHTSTWQENSVNSYYKETKQSTKSQSTYDDSDMDMGMRAFLAYRPTQYSDLGGEINFDYSDGETTEDGAMKFFEPDGENTYSIKHDNRQKSNINRLAANLYYQNTFGKKGTLLKVTADYYYGNVKSSLENRMDSLLESNQTKPHEYYQEIIPQKAHIWSGLARFQTAFGKSTFLGVTADGYYSKVDNNDQFLIREGDEYVNDNIRSNHLKVDEWGVNLAAEMMHVWNKKWTTVVGSGLKRRVYHSEQINSHEKYEQEYWQPSPFLFIAYTPKENHNLRYQMQYYTSNPSFSQMNPFRRYTSATTYIVGNPTLSQVKQFKQTLTYRFLQRFTINIDHLYTADDIVTYNYVKENNMIEQRPENMADLHEARIYFSVHNLSYSKGQGSINIAFGANREWSKTAIPDGELYSRIDDSF